MRARVGGSGVGRMIEGGDCLVWMAERRPSSRVPAFAGMTSGEWLVETEVV